MKRHYVRWITLSLLTCCLILIILSSVTVPGPKGKALGHKDVHGNGPFPQSNGGINPAGVIIGSGGIKTNDITAGVKSGNGFNPSGMGANKIILGQPGGGVIILNSQTNRITGNRKKVIVPGGKNLVLGAGDIFSNTLLDTDSMSASLIIPDPIGVKGPNPTHGGSHPKKDGGNPGGGNGNGNWGAGNQGNGIGNNFTGNQGRGVGAGMANSSESEPPEPPEPPVTFVEAAPLPKEREFKMGQCPALMELVAAELGVPKDNIQVNIKDTLADPANIQPCNSYARFIICAAVLGDPGQTGLTALAEVIGEFVSPTRPISEELLAEISQALAADRNGNDKSHYATAAQWLDAFVEYVVTLNTQMRWSVDESVVFTMEKYVTDAKEGSDVTLLTFLHLQLQVLISS
jgi:hypothetical protein